MTDRDDKTKAKNQSKSSAIWEDEKATANAKHDRHDHQSRDEPLGDALSIGAGQVSSPFLTEIQADAIAKQTSRNNGK
jgi:hypothetical protein